MRKIVTHFLIFAIIILKSTHSYLKSTQKSVVDITNAIQELKPQVRDHVCYSLLKSKVVTNYNSLSKLIKLGTSGTPVKI